jgi:chaperonin GroES
MTKINPSNHPTKVLRFPTPTFDNIIVEPLEEKYEGRILMLEGSKQKPTEGMIINTGPGRRTPEGVTVPMSVHPGQRVIFNQYAGSEIKYNDRLYLIVPEGEIKAVFPPPMEFKTDGI